MMENKCNKTPNNNNNINHKYMDHIYCHTNQNNKAYNNNNQMTAAAGGGSGSSSVNADVLALLKENKQLKAMLILHLNLIQEQSDQLIAKEKVFLTQSEEMERLIASNKVLKIQVAELQKQLQRQHKRTGDFTALPPPPLAKIQSKPKTTVAPLPTKSKATTTTTTTTTTPSFHTNSSAVTSVEMGTQGSQSAIIGECNGKLISKIILQRVNVKRKGKQSKQSPQSLTTDTENDEGEDDEDDENMEDDKNANEENENHKGKDRDNEGSIRMTYDKGPRKKRQSANVEDLEDTGNSTEDSNEVLAVQSKRLRLRQAAKLSVPVLRGAKPGITMTPTTKTNKGHATFKAVTSKTTHTTVNATTPTPSRGKHLPLMRWHAPDFHTDESASCDSTAETERRSTSVTSASPPKNYSGLANDDKRYSSLSAPIHSYTHHTQTRLSCAKHCSYISTSQLYCCREWENETFAADNNYEFIKAEAKALVADAPMLEIPKWTEHELAPSYCIEGTEDLSDDIFLKRHAKLEVCEKRRKKWDVQQIRESRRIERLKRRHCKDEIHAAQEPPMLQSFYPGSDTIQTIQFMQDLPVQAFGEMIPCLGAATVEQRDFRLPWLYKDLSAILNTTVSAANQLVLLSAPAPPKNTFNHPTQQQMLNSAFVFMKKRKRQQSSSITVTSTSRQRTLAVKAAASTCTTSPQRLQQMLPVTAPTTKSDVSVNNTSNTVTTITTTTTNNRANTNSVASTSTFAICKDSSKTL